MQSSTHSEVGRSHSTTAQAFHLGTPEGRAEQRKGWRYSQEELDSWNAKQEPSDAEWKSDRAESAAAPATTHYQ
eukprot:4041176-Karenia_brevis.AAC.1